VRLDDVEVVFALSPKADMCDAQMSALGQKRTAALTQLRWAFKLDLGPTPGNLLAPLMGHAHP